MTAAPRWLLLPFVFLASWSVASAQEPSPTPAAPASPASASGPTAKYVWSQCRVDGPYIAMTFDDGPSAKLTPRLLDILKERRMHVTFFLVGENAKAHPEIVQRELAEGHEIGDHSWNHPDLSKLPNYNPNLKRSDNPTIKYPDKPNPTNDDVQLELSSTKDAIAAAIGQAPTLMRPPYGSLTAAQKKWVHDELGFKIILWDVDPDDWKRPGPAIVEKRILEGTHNGSIILSHDIQPGTIEAMPSTFDNLLAKGFKFVTVSELIAMNQPDPPKSSPKPGMAKAKTAATPRREADPSLPTKINGSAN